MDVISDTIKTEFRQNGVVCLRNVFSSEWIAKVKNGIEYNIKHPGEEFGKFLREDKSSGDYFTDYCNWTRICEFNDYVLNSPAAEIAAALMDSKYSLFYHDHVLYKEPGTTKAIPWHHDQPYHPFDGLKACSVWMPVYPVSKQTCVQYVKGSHLWNQLYIPRMFSTNRNYLIENSNDIKRYKEMPDIDANKNKYEFLSWEVQPGDCIVFSMRTLHGAAGNIAQKDERRVLTTRWLGDDVTFTGRPWTVLLPIEFGLKQGDRPFKSRKLPIIWGKY